MTLVLTKIGSLPPGERFVSLQWQTDDKQVRHIILLSQQTDGTTNIYDAPLA